MIFKSTRGKNIFSKKKNNFFWFWIFLISIFFFIAGSIYLVVYSGLFRIKNFEVKTTPLVSRDSFINTLESQMVGDAPWRSWIGKNNILFWNFRETPEQISASLLPALSDFTIKTNIFSRKLAISVNERELFGIWCVIDVGCYGFDKKGILFTQFPEVEGVLILKIYDANKRPVVLGESVLESQAWLSNMIAIINIFRDNQLPITIVRVNDFSLGEWEVEIGGRLRFYFSFDFIPEHLDNILGSIAKKLDFDKISYLDFRVLNRIYYK